MNDALESEYNPRIIGTNLPPFGIGISSLGNVIRKELALLGVSSSAVTVMLARSYLFTIKLENLSRAQVNVIKSGGSAGVEAVISGKAVRSNKYNVIISATYERLVDFSDWLKSQPFPRERSLTSRLAQISEVIRTTIDNYLHKPQAITIPRHPVRPGARPGGKVKKLDFTRPLIMGIVNITPDSFSDGGRFYNAHIALPGCAGQAGVNHALEMIESGADIIDIGGESTRPGASPVSLKEELNRVIPVIKSVIKAKPGAIISIDTYKSSVAEAAIKAGARIVNDISGLAFDKRMAGLVARYRVPVIIMHIKGTPRNMQDNPAYTDIMSKISRYFRERIALALDRGIDRSQIIVDPGIGFGKRLEDNYEIINRLAEFRSLGQAVMVGPSRKSFIGKVLKLPPCGEAHYPADARQTEGSFGQARLIGTVASVTASILNGADIVRVHDVAEIKQAALICEHISHPTRFRSR